MRQALQHWAPLLRQSIPIAKRIGTLLYFKNKMQLLAKRIAESGHTQSEWDSAKKG